jgi:hypothetical protein
MVMIKEGFEKDKKNKKQIIHRIACRHNKTKKIEIQ